VSIVRQSGRTFKARQSFRRAIFLPYISSCLLSCGRKRAKLPIPSLLPAWRGNLNRVAASASQVGDLLRKDAGLLSN